jgi:hypothetical protein
MISQRAVGTRLAARSEARHGNRSHRRLMLGGLVCGILPIVVLSWFRSESPRAPSHAPTAEKSVIVRGGSGDSLRVRSVAAPRPEQLNVSAEGATLIARLVRPVGDGQITPDAVMAWDDKLSALVALGTKAVTAIRGFLLTNSENEWNPAMQQVLGYRSPREALIEALRAIGGAEAESALVSTLSETMEPREIAFLARSLESLAPGQYRIEAIQAAKRSLDAQLDAVPGTAEVAPLFEVLYRLGDTSTASDLERGAAHWNYYASYALAQLPDGAGVASLVRLTERSNSNPVAAIDPAVRLLCSLSREDETAREAFLDLVRRDRIATTTWAQLAPILAGAQIQLAEGVLASGSQLDSATAQRVHLKNGNQNFLVGMPASVRAEQMERQLAWLDQLSALVANPTAKEAIQDAWRNLHLRLDPFAPNANEVQLRRQL